MQVAKTYKVGADPELFVQQGGVLKSAFGLVQGTKEAPFPVKYGAVQVDGMALEFNIDPAESEDEFVFNINNVVVQLKALVPTYKVLAIPVAEFSKEYMQAQPLAATELGCTPDYNAWSGRENIRPDAEVFFRTGAGHIHIGWTTGANIEDREHLDMCERVVRQLDAYLGIPSILFDSSSKRRELYGKAGAYRPKSYGVEYRVLSNVWVGEEHLTRWVYRTTIKALQDIEKGIELPIIAGARYNIQNIINKSLVPAAKKFCQMYNLEVPDGLL